MMAIVATSTVTMFDAAVLLRARLGDIRNWYCFLEDCKRERQSLDGLTLMPCAKRKDGRMFRPVYSVDDIQDFIDKALATVPGTGKTPIKVTTLPINEAVPWVLNKFDKHGNPAIPATTGISKPLSTAAHLH